MSRVSLVCKEIDELVILLIICFLFYISSLSLARGGVEGDEEGEERG